MSAASERPEPVQPEQADSTEPASIAPEPTVAPARPSSVRRSLASIVLAFETIVVFLAALVLWGLADASGGVWGLPSWAALVAGGVIILLLVATIGLLRFRFAFWLGWAIQVVVIVAGIINPAMYVVGALFGGLWAYCMVVGARIDRDRAAAAEPGKEPQ
ncbi:DUF4233 domain-containing protein [Agromyces intestinalis]|uniref:DUF4233 domain-containing protein n=1 Tax=Agromyces intestinalis TaxID=2592652 RepID=A0A5C1YKX2_9MICO|nr:DUF4233 domain-containing protein [Agromyces intestinalis]QEO15940.1 DUF4233 domain-containing protein [Agromyces intestinalis]